MSIALVAAAYLLGSFPTGVVLARAKGVDLRAVGSGNIGATNVGRALGRRWGVVVMLVDAAKGFLPVFLGARLLRAPVVVLVAAGLAAILGHMFTIFLKGKGGKGVATSFGAAAALAPLPALCALGVYAALLALFRISSIGSLSAVLSFPLFLWVFGHREPAHHVFAGAIVLLVFIRHADNLRRLARGQEYKA